MKTAEELRIEFQSEMDTKVFNEQGEIDIDYVLWLELKVIAAQSQPTDEEIEIWANDKAVEALSGSNFTPIVIEMNELAMKAAITGAKAHRDNLIKKGE